VAETQSQGLERLLSDTKADPTLLKDLMFEPEKALAKLDYLSRSQKAALLAIDPEKLLSGAIGAGAGAETTMACGGSCGNSCAGTCTGSCGGTCSDSCRGTCGATSCNRTTSLQIVSAEAVINPVVDQVLREVTAVIERFQGGR
jgi:hypothetical protein